MSKLYEVKTPQEWSNLATLVGSALTGIMELFNAGREGGVDILWTESASVPTAGAFFRILKRQKSAIFTLDTQPVWVKSESIPAKLMVSKPNTTTINLEGKA